MSRIILSKMSNLRNRTSINKYSISLHLSVILFGLAGIFGKLINQPTLFIVTGRVFFAFISLLIFRQFSRIKYQKINKAQIYLLILSGLILVTHWFSFFYAIQKSSVSAGLFMFASFPIFSLVLEKLYYKNRVYLLEITSIIICIIGLFIISYDFNAREISFFVIITGIYSGFSFALLGIINKHLVQKQNVVTINLIQYLTAFILLGPYLIHNLNLFYNLSDILLLLLLGIVFTALSHSLFIYSLKHIDIFKASLISCLEPVYGSLIAVIILSEKLTIYLIVGGLLIILSSIILKGNIQLYQKS